MANYTTNYSFKKPLGNENYNVEDQNGNMDLIDAKIKEIDNKASNITVPVTSVNNKTGAVSLAASDVGAVSTTRKVNNKPLSSDINLVAADINTADGTTLEKFKIDTNSSLKQKADLVGGKIPIAELPELGYVPTERTINGKPLSSNITLTASDVGAGGLPGYSVYGYPTGSYTSYSINSIDTLTSDYLEVWLEVYTDSGSPSSDDICTISLNGVVIHTIKFSQMRYNLIKIFIIKGTYGVKVSNNEPYVALTYASLFDRLILPPTSYTSFTRSASSYISIKGTNNNLAIGNVRIISRK